MEIRSKIPIHYILILDIERLECAIFPQVQCTLVCNKGQSMLFNFHEYAEGQTFL
jgi:hypothetical protein